MIQSPILDLSSGPITVERIDSLVRQYPFPAVTESVVTFLYRGHAESVELRHWIYGLPSTISMTRIEGTDSWYCAMVFPQGSRVEYKFCVKRDGYEEWLLDPLNPNVAHDPFGGNSVVHCFGYEEPEWAFPSHGIDHGNLETIGIESESFGDQREISVYLPARYKSYRRHRLLVVHDGNDYIRYSNLMSVLDNLIDRLEIPPLVVALTNPNDRLREYANDERHAKHIVEELIPFLENRFSLINAASGRCIMGASFGGVASLSTVWRFPEAFDSLLLQSGSFAFTDIGDHWRGPEFDPVVKFMNSFRQHPNISGKKMFLSCGVYESLIYENRSLVPFLNQNGAKAKLVEAYDGHNWENWRDRLRDGLTWLFRGPYWVTYP